jgi:HD-like signal output (HDOD) protein
MQNINSSAAEKLVASISIPPRPTVLQAVMAEQQAEAPNLARISQAISTDVGLSASILKAVNSPLYGLRSRVNSVHHGVMMLGPKNVLNLVTGLSLRLAVKGNKQISLDRFWDSAADTAIIARALSRELFIADPDDAYLLGLFHDCGIPLLMMKFPDYLKFLIEANKDRENELSVLEEAIYQTNHTVVGNLVARNWRLPEHICTAILKHHELQQLTSEDEAITPLIYILTLAGHVSHRVRRLTMDHAWERVQDKVMTYFELDTDQYEMLIEDMEIKLKAE